VRVLYMQTWNTNAHIASLALFVFMHDGRDTQDPQTSGWRKYTDRWCKQSFQNSLHNMDRYI